MRSTRSARTQVLSSFCSSITHGSAGGGTASPECPAGLQGPGGAAAPRGHLPRPEAPPRRSPGLHPAGPAGVDEGHSEPAGPKAAARAKRGSFQTHLRPQIHPGPPSQGGRNGQANRSFPSSESLLPNIEICWKMDVKYCPKEPRLRLGNTRPRVRTGGRDLKGGVPRAPLRCV